MKSLPRKLYFVVCCLLFVLFIFASLHPIKAQEEDASFIPVNDLKIGDWVFVKGDEENLVPEQITKLEWIEGPIEVYNLTVEGEETFFANNFAVHNKGEHADPWCGVEIQPQVSNLVWSAGEVVACSYGDYGVKEVLQSFNVTPGRIYEIKSHATEWSDINKRQPYCPEKDWFWVTCAAPFYRVDTTGELNLGLITLEDVVVTRER